LNLKYDGPLSSFAFNRSMRHCTKVREVERFRGAQLAERVAQVRRTQAVGAWQKMLKASQVGI